MSSLTPNSSFCWQRMEWVLCTIIIFLTLYGCNKAQNTQIETVSEESAALHSENEQPHTFDAAKDIDLDSLMTIIQNRGDTHIIDAETINSIMDKYGDDIRRRAVELNAEFDHCMETLSSMADSSECKSVEYNVLNVLMEEKKRVDWLKAHGQPDSQRALWQALLNEDYYWPYCWSYYANDAGVLKHLISEGADLNAPNWDGNAGAFKIKDISYILELLQSGTIKYDVKDADGNTLLHKYPDDDDLFDSLIKAGFDINTRNKDGITPIFNVNKPDNIEKYTKAGADIHIEDFSGNTPLFFAARNDDNNFSLSTQLVRLGADINHKNHSGETPIFYIKSGADNFIKLGADPKIIDNNGNTVLNSYKILNDTNNLDDLRAYIKAGVDVKKQTNVPLLDICLYRKKDEWITDWATGSLWKMNKLCVELIKDSGADIYAPDSHGNSFLEYNILNYHDFAIKYDYVRPQEHHFLAPKDYDYVRNELKFVYNRPIPDFIQLVAKVRSEYDRMDRYDGFSGDTGELYGMLEYLNRVIVNMLKDGVLNVQERGPNGNTWLFYTNNETSKALIEAGADVNAKNDNGETALWSGDIPALLEAGANANVVGPHGKTPLLVRHVSYDSNDTGSWPVFAYYNVAELLEHGADINARDEDGRSLIFYVFNEFYAYSSFGDELCDEEEYNNECGRYQENALSFLIQRGANVNLKDKTGTTPLMMAIRELSIIIVRSLIQAGADVNAKDNDGQTILDICNSEIEWASKKYGTDSDYYEAASAIREILKEAGAK